MGEAYVVHGTKARCTMGSMSNYLNTKNGHGVVYKGQPLLNANDHIPEVNITSFGTCTAMQGMKCVAVTPLAWQFCNTKHLIDGAPALTTKSKCMCLLGGMISIEAEGGAGAGGGAGGADGAGADQGGEKDADAPAAPAENAATSGNVAPTEGAAAGPAGNADSGEDDEMTVWEFLLPFPLVWIKKEKKRRLEEFKKKKAEEEKKPDEKLYRHTEEMVKQITQSRPEFDAAVKKFKEVYQRQKTRYKKIADTCGAPPELIAVLHYRENTSDYLKETFGVYLHNGQKLGKKTSIHPVGKLFDDFDKAAEDAISTHRYLLKKFHLTAGSKDIIAMMCFAESYNGLGYFKNHRISPYLYSGTNVYTSGKYTSDGHYDEGAVDKQVGVYLLLNSIAGSGSEDKGSNSPKAGEDKGKPAGVAGTKTIIKIKK